MVNDATCSLSSHGDIKYDNAQTPRQSSHTCTSSQATVTIIRFWQPLPREPPTLEGPNEIQHPVQQQQCPPFAERGGRRNTRLTIRNHSTPRTAKHWISSPVTLL